MTGFPRIALRLSGRARRAVTTADILDRAVDNQLPALDRLPADARRRAADHLAELALLAEAYRQYARGRITKRELHRRGRQATARLTELRLTRLAAAHLTERD
ncbi:hypothetical protein V5P93_000044 [Actinokineospora auranticolor]|uniref:Uncharacterized protein n=1 Tax=Actinokineospora auranticolor TaxID=155976 RepID=A0A2S6GSF1_9PSEU|nr:hypothetical protein [Actinokineospora auranticolor]PPK68140.1 hypothetical protein CLV40_106377 [Actinokineospora auranticolor]